VIAPELLLSVGALFTGGAHFSTGSVIACPGRDLILTAAHSLTGKDPADVTFVAGYGVAEVPPVFQLTRVFFPPLWLAERNIDNDFAIAQVTPALTPLMPLSIATGWRQAQPSVVVPSYPDAMSTQLVGEGTTEAFGASQMMFRYDGYTDGTSGSPFIVYGDNVIGALGGYQQGGDTPDVSYAACFRENMAQLLATARQQSPPELRLD
jgi:hypothetical protein